MSVVRQLFDDGLIAHGHCAIKTALIAHRKSDIDSAVRIFEGTPREERDSMMFGAVLSALIRHERARKALQIYAEMDASQRDSVCDALALKASTVGAIFDAPQSLIDIDAIERRARDAPNAICALIHHFGRTVTLARAQRVVVRTPSALRPREALNAMMVTFIRHRRDADAQRVFDEHSHVDVDSVAHSLALKACANSAQWSTGEAIIDALSLDERAKGAPLQLKHSRIHFFGACGDVERAQRHCVRRRRRGDSECDDDGAH